MLQQCQVASPLPTPPSPPLSAFLFLPGNCPSTGLFTPYPPYRLCFVCELALASGVEKKFLCLDIFFFKVPITILAGILPWESFCWRCRRILGTLFCAGFRKSRFFFFKSQFSLSLSLPCLHTFPPMPRADCVSVQVVVNDPAGR